MANCHLCAPSGFFNREILPRFKDVLEHVTALNTDPHVTVYHKQEWGDIFLILSACELISPHVTHKETGEIIWVILHYIRGKKNKSCIVKPSLFYKCEVVASLLLHSSSAVV